MLTMLRHAHARRALRHMIANGGAKSLVRVGGYADRPGIQQALDQLSGEIWADAGMASAANRRAFATALGDHLAGLSDDPAASQQAQALNDLRNLDRDMIRKQTITYNRTRQAMITKELIEIISGAEAL